MGIKFVNSLTDALWYLDGHHDLFSSRTVGIPCVFTEFQGCNKPELSKHRKRVMTNLNYSVLERHVASLSSHLQCKYWDSPTWSHFKSDCQNLLEALYDYKEHLSKKRRVMNENHQSDKQICSLSNNIQLSILPVVDSTPIGLHSLASELETKDCYVSVFVNDFAPTEPILKYRYMETLKCGLHMPCLLFTYSPGSNIGNQSYIWKITASGDEVFTLSQKTIEEVKMKLPVFHTRAMREAMYQKYGRVCPSLKPATLCFLYHDLTGKLVYSNEKTFLICYHSDSTLWCSMYMYIGKLVVYLLCQ